MVRGKYRGKPVITELSWDKTRDLNLSLHIRGELQVISSTTVLGSVTLHAVSVVRNLAHNKYHKNYHSSKRKAGIFHWSWFLKKLFEKIIHFNFTARCSSELCETFMHNYRHTNRHLCFLEKKRYWLGGKRSFDITISLMHASKERNFSLKHRSIKWTHNYLTVAELISRFFRVCYIVKTIYLQMSSVYFLSLALFSEEWWYPALSH